MTDNSPNLTLPYIMAAQAQKHVTHNEAVRALDAIVQLSVIDRNLAAPPVSPADGDRYIVAAAASGAWTGRENEIAAFQDGAWMFYAPAVGWISWIDDEQSISVWDGAGWAAIGGGSVNPVPLVGINAIADLTNKLSINSPASLFNHDGGGHNMKLNKAASGDTASTLFQSGFSGRAEMGLTGDDDFHVKVSADGSSWLEALVIDRSTGRVVMPATPAREVLMADRTYHVSPAGNDANDGLATGSGNALQTINAAVEKAVALDPNGFAVTIRLADGTYSAATGTIVMSQPMLDGGMLTIEGNTAAPGNVVVASTAATVVEVSNRARLRLEGVKLTQSGAGSSISLDSNAYVAVSDIEFGAAVSRWHVENKTGTFEALGDYKISGGAIRHIYAFGGSRCFAAGITITLTGSPAFGNGNGYFYEAESSLIRLFSVSYVGAGTGNKYKVVLNGSLNTFGGLSFLPVPGAGAILTGGQVA